LGGNGKYSKLGIHCLVEQSARIHIVYLHCHLQRAFLVVQLEAHLLRAQLQAAATIHSRDSGNIQGTFNEHSGNIQGTFREYSRNIQGTLREHTGNIQKTLREHSGRVERTPVSLHPNCKKHFKKKSTKVDAEYNLQT
jgi:hypothetical protein